MEQGRMQTLAVLGHIRWCWSCMTYMMVGSGEPWGSYLQRSGTCGTVPQALPLPCVPNPQLVRPGARHAEASRLGSVPRPNVPIAVPPWKYRNSRELGWEGRKVAQDSEVAARDGAATISKPQDVTCRTPAMRAVHRTGPHGKNMHPGVSALEPKRGG